MDNNKNEIDNIELRSEKVRHIIGQVPPALVRIGTAVVTLVVMALAIAFYTIRYPITIEAQGKVGTVVKRLKLYNRLIVNVIENSYLCVGKKNTSNRPRKAEFGGIAKINLHGKGTKFLRNITGSSVHRV